MINKTSLESAVLLAARDFGISTVLFRNSLAKNRQLTLTESLCLTILGVKGPLSPTALARLIGLTSGATTSLLDRLEARGHICRRANAKDRRGVIIELTEDQADQHSELLITKIQAANNSLVQSLTDQDLKVILDFLKGFTANYAAICSDVSFIFDEYAKET